MRSRPAFSISAVLFSLLTAGCISAACSACRAQAPGAERQAGQQAGSSDAIQANLERLVQLTQELEREQKAILAFEKLEVYELRLQGLETRQDILSQREQDLSAKAAQMEKFSQAQDSGLSPTGVPQSTPNPVMQTHASEQFSATSRLLDSTRTEKAGVEHEIEKLRTRMAALEKAMGDDAP